MRAGLNGDSERLVLCVSSGKLAEKEMCIGRKLEGKRVRLHTKNFLNFFF